MGGCTIYTALAGAVTIGSSTDVLGITFITLAIPNVASLVGAELWTQWAIADPNGALLGLASLSDALHVMIGTR